MTVKEKFGTYRKTMVYVGIWNNVFNSLVASFPRLGGRLIGVCPIINSAAISAPEATEVIKATENLNFMGAQKLRRKNSKTLSMRPISSIRIPG